jgi:hypothetical protein
VIYATRATDGRRCNELNIECQLNGFQTSQVQTVVAGHYVVWNVVHNIRNELVVPMRALLCEPCSDIFVTVTDRSSFFFGHAQVVQGALHCQFGNKAKGLSGRSDVDAGAQAVGNFL